MWTKAHRSPHETGLEEIVLGHAVGEMARWLPVQCGSHRMDLADQTGRATSEGVEIGYPLSRQDIAEIAGTDLYTVSRILRRWAVQGFVSANRLHVVLLDRGVLKRISQTGR